MELYQRDFFMQRIICGYNRYKLKSGAGLIVCDPESELLYDSQEVYTQVFAECVNDGLIQEQDLLTWMYDRGLWDDMKEHDISKGITEDIENIKIEMYNNSYDEFKVLTLRNHLQQLKDKLANLYYEKHSYDYTTANGVASFMKNYYIVENSVKFAKTKELYDWSEDSILNLMLFRDKNSITDDNVRCISKYHEWKGIWYASKYNGNLFDRLSVNLTSEQKRLIFWSAFYDNLAEHPDCPPEKIIEDDDLIDGWVIIQRRKREKEKSAQDTQQKIGNEKIKKAGEVFIVARDEKHAQDIEALNSPHAAALKQARLNQIKKNGEMKDADFRDVKTKIAMEAVRKGNDMMRGGK